MRKRNRQKIVSLVAIGLLLLSLLLCGYSSLEEKVFDDADLLTEQEEQRLQEDIVKLAEKMSLDIVVVTTDDAQGKSAQAYADDFYDDHHFGYEQDDGSGILFLIDMDNREFYISTAGQAIAEFTDWEMEEILYGDEIYPYLADGQYYQACRGFLSCVEEYGQNKEVAQNGYYDTEEEVFVDYTPQEIQQNRKKAAIAEALSAKKVAARLLLAMVFGAAGVGIMVVNVRSQKTPNGRVYVKPGSEYIRDRRDHKINTTVRTRHIPRNNGGGGARSGGGGGSRGVSSSHRSSAGRSHGGGGRRF